MHFFFNFFNDRILLVNFRKKSLISIEFQNDFWLRISFVTNDFIQIENNNNLYYILKQNQ